MLRKFWRFAFFSCHFWVAVWAKFPRVLGGIGYTSVTFIRVQSSQCSNWQANWPTCQPLILDFRFSAQTSGFWICFVSRSGCILIQNRMESCWSGSTCCRRCWTPPPTASSGLDPHPSVQNNPPSGPDPPHWSTWHGNLSHGWTGPDFPSGRTTSAGTLSLRLFHAIRADSWHAMRQGDVAPTVRFCRWLCSGQQSNEVWGRGSFGRCAALGFIYSLFFPLLIGNLKYYGVTETVLSDCFQVCTDSATGSIGQKNRGGWMTMEKDNPFTIRWRTSVCHFGVLTFIWGGAASTPRLPVLPCTGGSRLIRKHCTKCFLFDLTKFWIIHNSKNLVYRKFDLDSWITVCLIYQIWIRKPCL